MEFNNDTLARFIGGEFEVENTYRNCRLRGAIKLIHIQRQSEGVKLTVELDWCATEDGYPNLMTMWRARDMASHPITTAAYSITDCDNGVLIFTPKDNRGDWIVLRPQGQAMLDRSEVSGL